VSQDLDGGREASAVREGEGEVLLRAFLKIDGADGDGLADRGLEQLRGTTRRPAQAKLDPAEQEKPVRLRVVLALELDEKDAHGIGDTGESLRVVLEDESGEQGRRTARRELRGSPHEHR
jgi:hypothetical protein